MLFFISTDSRDRKILIDFKTKWLANYKTFSFGFLLDNCKNLTHSVSQCDSRQQRALVLWHAFDSRLSCLLTLLQHHWASCLRDQPWPSNLVNFNTLILWLSSTSWKSRHNYSFCHNIPAGRTYTLVCSDHPLCLTIHNKTKDFGSVKMNKRGKFWEMFYKGRITQMISQLPGNSCSNKSRSVFQLQW